jgi:hypothetical protein
MPLDLSPHSVAALHSVCLSNLGPRPVAVNHHHLAKKSAEYPIPRPETVSNNLALFYQRYFFYVNLSPRRAKAKGSISLYLKAIICCLKRKNHVPSKRNLIAEYNHCCRSSLSLFSQLSIVHSWGRILLILLCGLTGVLLYWQARDNQKSPGIWPFCWF